MVIIPWQVPVFIIVGVVLLFLSFRTRPTTLTEIFIVPFYFAAFLFAMVCVIFWTVPDPEFPIDFKHRVERHDAFVKCEADPDCANPIYKRYHVRSF